MKKFKISFIEIVYLLSFLIIGVGVYFSTISPFKKANEFFDVELIHQIKIAKKYNNTHNNILKDYNVAEIKDGFSGRIKIVYFMKYLLHKGVVAHVWYRDFSNNLYDFLIYYPFKAFKDSKISFGNMYRLKEFPKNLYVKDDTLYLEFSDKVYKIVPKDDELDYEIL